MQKESTNSLLANLPCRDKNNFSKANLYDTTARNAREVRQDNININHQLNISTSDDIK